MTGTSYVPGTWLGIVRSHTAVILGSDTPPALADSVWNLIAGKTEVYEVLQAITGSAGGNLSRIPPFAILDFAGPLRVFLRGGLELSVETPEGPAELNGRDVTTWSERSFAVPGPCTLMIPGAGETGQPELRLGDGMVLLQAIRLGAAGQGALEGLGAAEGRTVPAGATADAAAVLAPESLTDSDAAADPAVVDTPLTAVAVDSSGTAEVLPDASSAKDAAAGPAADPGAPDAGAGALPETAIAPGRAEVSVETVYAVLDEDGEYSGHGGAQHAGTGDESGATDNDPAENDAAGNDPAAHSSVEGGAADHDSGDNGSPEAAATGPDLAGDADNAPGAAVPGAADLPAAIDLTSSYDHLWERTVVRNIEDAAVREEPAEDGHGAAPAIEAVAPQAAIDADAAEKQASEHPLHNGADTPDVQEGAGLPPAAAPKPATGLLIESVPWRTGGAATTPAQAPPPFTPAPAVPAAPPSAASQGFGAPGILQSGVSQSGTHQDSAGAAAPQGQGSPHTDFDDDHDGQTVMKSSLAGAGGQEASAAGQAAHGATPANGPMVLARVCPQGHANPPIRSACTLCGAPLPQDAVQVGRPRLGRMRLSTGELLDLDQSLVIGRQPSVSRVQGGGMPRLVQVPSPGGDISRSHVEVRLEGWHVMLCDLKATNGTVLVREGQSPRRLAQNEMAILLDGDIAELGDNISLRFEEIP